MRLIPDDVLGKLTVWAEARGEPMEGKIAVAEVIQRRTKMKYFSDGTVAGTVLRRYQFSCWSDKDPNFVPMLMADSSDASVQECMDAWWYAKQGQEVVPGALLYCNLDISQPGWAKPERLVKKIGKHSFFNI